MRRTATVSLDHLGPDTRQFARDAAKRAGVPVEEWLATAMADAPAERGEARRSPEPRRRPDPAPRPRRRVAEAAPEPQADREAQTDRETLTDALVSVEHFVERAEAQMAAAARAALEQQDRATAAVGEAIALIAHRLDDLDQKVVDGRQVSTEAALKAVETMEGRLRAAVEAGAAPEARIEDMLRAFESRIAGLSERVAGTTPRPIGRRGRPTEAELTGAVAEIRERQREIEAEAAPVRAPFTPRLVVTAPEAPTTQAPAPATDIPAAAFPVTEAAHAATLHALRGDVARIASQIKALQSGGAVVQETVPDGLSLEIVRLREGVEGLATKGEISTLERAVHALASDVGRARAPADLAAIAAPVDLLRVQVGRLSDDVAANVHGRLAADVDHLAGKIDAVARSVSAAGGARDHDAFETMLGEFAEIRARLAELAGPDRIQELVRGVHDLEARIAALRQEPETAFAALRPILEDIRATLRAPAAPLSAELDRRFDAFGHQLDAKLDTLGERASPAALGAASSAVSSAILDRLAALETKVDRAVARPPAATGDVMPALLSRLAERIEQVERSGGMADGLDALERQILSLAERIDTRGGDPAIASLERSMTDLVHQVATLREEPAPPRAPGIDALKTDLAGLKAEQDVASERIHTTMEGVHTALEQLVGRLAAIEDTPAPAPSPVRAAPRTEPVRRAAPEPAALPLVDDVLLEPGTRRPEPALAPAPARAEPETGDIKANFIAAARRAAQSAAAEASRGSTREVRPDPGTRGAPRAKAAAAGPGVLARVRETLDRRRRPLLLGLAAVVLALGALQAVGSFMGDRTVRTAAPAREIVEPRTTQSLAPRATEKPAESRTPEKLAETRAPEILSPTRAPLPGVPAPPTDRFAATEPAAAPLAPRVPGMASMTGEFGALPPGLANLRQAVLDGDPTAVYELAARAADGRGLPRDPKLAARLFEKLATLGFAPAQYRLGNQYEKGLGVPRDLTSAKSWYQRAAEGGNTRAMHNLAVLLAESGAEPGKPDYPGAVTWFRKAAEYGVRDSQYNLAVLLARGLGVQQDLAQSYLWFAAAAGQGDEDAGRKRDDVGAKMAGKDLEAARSAAARWRARPAEPAANEMPAPAVAGSEIAKPGATALMGAPMPITPPVRRSEAAPPAGGRV